jgi:hypothetical protein
MLGEVERLNLALRVYPRSPSSLAAEGTQRTVTAALGIIPRCLQGIAGYDPQDINSVDRPVPALENKQIAGAALDVFDIEPLPSSHPFRTLDNVLATPHLGYVSEGLYKTFYEDTVSNIRKWLDTQHPPAEDRRQ